MNIPSVPLKYVKTLLVFCLFTIIQIQAAAIIKDPSKKTICLNMIVKNEAHVIVRCLESVLPIIDSWVIVDTGSTDGTQKVIKDYLKDIPGELHERPWVNFGHNRDEALQLAKPKADYILFMDADDKLVFEKDFKFPPLTDDCYLVATQHADLPNKSEYYLPRLISSRNDWHWLGVLHEHVYAERADTITPLIGVKYIYLSGGARSKDPMTYRKDIEILLEGLKNEPNNERYLFYLARSYSSINDLDNALKYYQMRATMKQGLEQEIYLSLIKIGNIYDFQNKDPETVIQAYKKAFEFRPERLEPLYFLSRKYTQIGQPQKAYDILNKAVKMPMTKDMVYVETWIYDYGLLFEYSVTACLIEKYEEAILICKQLLAINDLPDQFKKDTQNNLQYAENKWSEKLRSQLLSELQL